MWSPLFNSNSWNDFVLNDFCLFYISVFVITRNTMKVEESFLRHSIFMSICIVWKIVLFESVYDADLGNTLPDKTVHSHSFSVANIFMHPVYIIALCN